jgi:hypothetical protein
MALFEVFRFVADAEFRAGSYNIEVWCFELV